MSVPGVGANGAPVDAAAPDTGLLAPVRAGTPVETAVSDPAWVRAMLDAEAALARAQARLGAVPAAAARVISETAGAAAPDPRALALASRETANPVVGLIQDLTRRVAAVDPVAAEYVHRGSTSQDIFDTGAMLVARRAVRLVLGDLEASIDALGVLASAHRDTPMAGRTLALHAVPTTFGLKAAGWRELLRDAHRRLERVGRHGLPVSLGGAAGTLAGYLEYAAVDGVTTDPGTYAAELAEAFAEETGLAVPVLPWHALRTPVADLAAALAFASGALGRLAVEVQNLARTEIAEAAEPAVSGRGGSSAMPHKRNPVLTTMIRSASLQVPALAGALTQCLTTEDERSGGTWHAEWLLLRECLRLVGGAAHTAAELTRGLRVDAARMRANLDLTASRVVTERIAARLAPELGKARAKELVAGAATEAEATGESLAAVLGRTAGQAGLAGTEGLDDLCDPTAYLGAAAALVERALKT
ncbi:lyase family protein [Streptomyces hyderabadensis]|uniref:Lyase family protein n=1 Tax=Streptomyces hyderabadensis TaxID=598549 RepID=A0ABP9IRH0_9ACTN|nr:lyase family protein [Streptomyces hyderabadensis]